MPKPDFNYRPDPGRSVNIFGEFTNDLVAQVLPQINALRAENNKPITVYINSNGGIVRCLEIILHAITADDIEGNGCRLITVAIGDAASAAATLFSLAGYAIAYPHSSFHFHGIRMGEVEVTMEDASTMATYLATRNREVALLLAEAMIARLAHRYSILVEEFPDQRKRANNEQLSEVACFALCVRNRVSPPAQRVIDRTLAHIGRVLTLSQNVFKRLKFVEGDNGLKQDASVLRAVLNYELKSRKSGEWRIDENGLAQVSSDYFLLRDFHIGEHSLLLDSIVQTFGYWFLNEKDNAEFINLPDGDDKAMKLFLAEKATPVVTLFWYFAVVFCRQLQQGENRLEARDAYWLGIADEIIGTNLTGVRMMMETDVNSAAETAS